MGALFGGIDEISIDDGEAENLARAVLDISKKRKVKLSPEILAWGNFAAVVATIYGPRLIAFLAPRRQMREVKFKPVIVDVDGAGHMSQQAPN